MSRNLSSEPQCPQQLSRALRAGIRETDRGETARLILGQNRFSIPEPGSVRYSWGQYPHFGYKIEKALNDISGAVTPEGMKGRNGLPRNSVFKRSAYSLTVNGTVKGPSTIKYTKRAPQHLPLPVSRASLAVGLNRPHTRE